MPAGSSSGGSGSRYTDTMRPPATNRHFKKKRKKKIEKKNRQATESKFN